MHEKIIAEEIIKKAKEHGKVKGILVEVGELAHLPAKEMGEVLKKITGWKIGVSKKEAVVKCGCGFEGAPKILEQSHDFVLFECPKCKEVPKVLEGHNIILKEVDVE